MAVEVFKGLLGDKVVNDKLEDVGIETFCGKPESVVGLYFSAHWCPPCRGFTPKLAEFYKKLKSTKDFEIVFVSSDKDDGQFKDYFGSMPWLALPYSNRDAKNALSKKFKVSGIPTLVLLNGETGETITKQGRGEVDNDPEGKKFPWQPRSLETIINGTKYVQKKGEDPKDGLADHLKGKVTGIYFSAHWCPPCRAFTPDLAEFYNNRKKSGKDDFEIVFASSDKEADAFDEYFGEMPWIAIPFSDRECKQELSNMFEVSGIPTLVILDKDLKTITSNGRAKVSSDPTGVDFPWYPKPLNKLDEGAIDDINNGPCLVLFTDKDHESDAITAMHDVAEKEHVEKKEKEEEKVCCFYAIQGEELTGNLRQFCNLGDKTPYLAIVDMSEKIKYVCDDFTDTCDKAKVDRFMQQYRDKQLTSKGIKD